MSGAFAPTTPPPIAGSGATVSISTIDSTCIVLTSVREVGVGRRERPVHLLTREDCQILRTRDLEGPDCSLVEGAEDRVIHQVQVRRDVRPELHDRRAA